MYTMYEIIVIQNDGELIDYLISVIKYLLNVYCKFMRTNFQVNLATGGFYLPTGIFAILCMISYFIHPEVVPGRMGLLVTLFLISSNKCV